MRRHILGLIALASFAWAAILGCYPPLASYQAAGAMGLRVGLVLGAFWLAWPDLHRLPRWVWYVLPIGVVALALRTGLSGFSDSWICGGGDSLFAVPQTLAIVALIDMRRTRFAPLCPTWARSLRQELPLAAEMTPTLACYGLCPAGVTRALVTACSTRSWNPPLKPTSCGRGSGPRFAKGSDYHSSQGPNR